MKINSVRSFLLLIFICSSGLYAQEQINPLANFDPDDIDFLEQETFKNLMEKSSPERSNEFFLAAVPAHHTYNYCAAHSLARVFDENLKNNLEKPYTNPSNREEITKIFVYVYNTMVDHFYPFYTFTPQEFELFNYTFAPDKPREIDAARNIWIEDTFFAFKNELLKPDNQRNYQKLVQMLTTILQQNVRSLPFILNEARRTLADLYRYGKGVPEDHEWELLLLNLIITDPEAQKYMPSKLYASVLRRVADMYFSGIGTTRDVDKAYEALLKFFTCNEPNQIDDCHACIMIARLYAFPITPTIPVKPEEAFILATNVYTNPLNYEIDPPDVLLAALLLGQISLSKNEYNKAQEYFEHVLASPNELDPHDYELARSYLKQTLDTIKK